MKILGKANTLTFLENNQKKFRYEIPPFLKFTKKFYFKIKKRFQILFIKNS